MNVKLHLYILGQLLFGAMICCVLWFVFIDWSKVTWFELIVAIGVGVAFINLLYTFFSKLAYGREISRQTISLHLPEEKTLSFATDNCTAGKFLVFSRNTNFLNLTGSIALFNGKGEIVEQLLLNPAIGRASDSVKTQKISRGGKAARLDMLRALTLPTVNPANSVAQVRFDLNWHPNARDSRLKPIEFDIIFRTRKSSQENFALVSRALLN